MDLLASLALGVSLAMDCLAVSLACAAADPRGARAIALRVSVLFACFQAGMLGVGWFAGGAIERLMGAWDQWIAFGLLAVLGLRMLVDAIRGEQEAGLPVAGMSWITALLLALATSVDALGAGLGLSLAGFPLPLPALATAVATAGLSLAGFLLGARVGVRAGRLAQGVGGLVLIAIGARILLEHAQRAP